jgi:LDH2 family malate/lactate/ureidoglycolate dehydrogenase
MSYDWPAQKRTVKEAAVASNTDRALTQESIRVDYLRLRGLVSRIFQALGQPENEADLSADVLTLADLRGVESHGVSHYIRTIYVPSLREGRINPRPKPRIVHAAPSTALIDGDGGMGMVVGSFAMHDAIRRASETGVGMAAVRNSRHFGMAAYYALMALPHDMIGISLTNAAPAVDPTFGRKAMLGTNPIAFAAPAGEEDPFVLDMATSTVPIGKLLVQTMHGGEIPFGWAVSSTGKPATDPATVRQGWMLTPLGGTPEGRSYKGYGLAVVVDILSGVLSLAGYSEALNRDYPLNPVGHFFAAIRIDAFCPASEFKAMMDEMIRALHATPPAEGAERVLVAGEIEFANERDRRANGIPLHQNVIDYLRELSAEVGVPFDLL